MPWLLRNYSQNDRVRPNVIFVICQVYGHTHTQLLVSRVQAREMWRKSFHREIYQRSRLNACFALVFIQHLINGVQTHVQTYQGRITNARVHRSSPRLQHIQPRSIVRLCNSLKSLLNPFVS